MKHRATARSESIQHERNRFEVSQATHLNRAVGLYFGLLVERRTRSWPARNRQESRRSLSWLFLSERKVSMASAPSRLQRLPSPSIRCLTTEPQADSTTPVPTGKPAARYTSYRIQRRWLWKNVMTFASASRTDFR